MTLGHRIAALVDESAQPLRLIADDLQGPVGERADRQPPLDPLDPIIEDEAARVVLGDAHPEAAHLGVIVDDVAGHGCGEFPYPCRQEVDDHVCAPFARVCGHFWGPCRVRTGASYGGKFRPCPGIILRTRLRPTAASMLGSAQFFDSAGESYMDCRRQARK